MAYNSEPIQVEQSSHCWPPISTHSGVIADEHIVIRAERRTDHWVASMAPTRAWKEEMRRTPAGITG